VIRDYHNITCLLVTGVLATVCDVSTYSLVQNMYAQAVLIRYQASSDRRLQSTVYFTGRGEDHGGGGRLGRQRAGRIVE